PGSRPGEAAVGGDGDVVGVLLRLGDVAAEGRAVQFVAEGERGDARGFSAHQRRLCCRPRFSAVRRFEDAGGGAGTRAEPGGAVAMRNKTGAAGGEAAFAGKGWRQTGSRNAAPGGPAVAGDDDRKRGVHRVAEGDAVF